jgi:hypothetical protein
VPGYLNITLASNQNNNGATTINQGGNEPLGSNNLFPIQDSEGAGAITNSATTTFVADKNVVSATKLFPTQIDKIVYDSSSDLTSQDVRTFLAKPIIINQGAFLSTDTYSTLASVSNPFDLILSGTDIYRDKLNGYLGFRATTVFKLVVNATRFQQGRYLMSYCAMGGANFGTSKNSKWFSDHVSTLVQRTTLPHVELDLCCDTEAVIRIPYNSALNFYPIGGFASTADDFGCLGVLKISPYVPLSAVSGDLSAPFTLYAWFEDVDLISAAIPQSGRAFSSVKVRGKNATETEQDSVNIGPISSALVKVRDASSILAQVPLLSSYMSAASWFADIGANAAKVFGWSKPVVLAPSTRVTQNYLPYTANTDGPDESFPLSLSYQNSVGMANGFSGTDVDEMDFKFLSTMPVWTTTSVITTGTTAGTAVATLLVNPMANVYTTVVNTATFSHFSPLQFVASHFSYWRGSIVFKLKFVKTEFHSGRLSVSFSPYNAAIATPAVIATTTSFLHKHIIDIREANEFTFVIPFISDSPYRTVNSATIGSIGNLYIHVVDPIRAPATVTQSVTMIVEKAAGPDIEFAVPKVFPYTYYSGISPQSNDAFSSVAQGSTVCSNVDSTIGMSLAKGDNSLNALHNIGEKITSFRALGKLPNQLFFVSAPTLANYLNVAPYLISSGTVVLTTNTAPTVMNDFYSRLASCYVYSRGGVRIKFVDNMPVTTSNPILVALETRSAGTIVRSAPIGWLAAGPSGALASGRLGMPILYYRAGYSGEVQVPQYSQYHSRVNSECVGNATNFYSDGNQSLAPTIFLYRVTNPPIATADASVLRSFSDDTNFGGFLSIPPMFALTSDVP